ncbi:MAG: hypothetical protein LBD38_00785 [Streptococcaceae bacterium]|nr:hypothetical protein [Streptococcaceae bacterium]
MFIPFEIGKKEFFDFSKDSEELKANLTSSFSTDEIHEILKVAEKKIFFFPPEKSPETKEMRLGKSEDFLQKLIDSGYTQESAKMIQAAAEVVHMELVYGKPENKFNDFSGVAKDLVELREKLIELKTFDHQHIVKIIQNAQKISDSPSIFAWSRKEYYTYSWSEKTGYIWSGEYKTTFHWFPPLYQVGLEYEYAWKLKRTYSYSKIFDFDIEIPRYLVRQVEPKTRVEVTPLYSFSYDVEEYVWDEPENNDSSLEQLPKNR